MTIKEQIENFKGDKRTKEYKDLLESLKDPNKERVLNFSNPAPWLEVKWLFSHYAEVFNTKKRKPCRCSGKINSMLTKLKNHYEK